MIKKGFIRLVITLFISLVLVWVGSEVAYYFLKSDTDRLPEGIELIIPVGTAEKVAAGESLKVGDIKLQDVSEPPYGLAPRRD